MGSITGDLSRVIARQDLLWGAGLAMAAELMFVCMGALVKILSMELPYETIVFLRNLLGLAVMGVIVFRNGWVSIGTRVPHLHLLRSLAGVAAMYCFFYALGHLPLANAMLLKLTAPLFIPLIALVWLHEAFPATARWATLMGFAGVTLILQPTGTIHPAALVGLLGGALAALAKVAVRRMSVTEPASRIVFYFAFAGTLISLVPLAWGWRTPTLEQWSLVLLLGVVASSGQLLLTRAYAIAPANQISPFTYSSVVFAALFGWIFWQEVMSLPAVLGALMIVAAGLLVLSSKSARSQPKAHATLPRRRLSE